MKRTIQVVVIAVFSFLSNFSFGQVRVGLQKGTFMDNIVALDELCYKTLRDSETLFYCGLMSNEEINTLQDQLSEFWTISRSIKCIPADEFKDHPEGNYSYIRLNQRTNIRSSSNSTGTATYRYSCHLFVPDKRKKRKKEKWHSVASFIVEPDQLDITKSDINEVNLITWKPGFIKTFLMDINKCLENKVYKTDTPSKQINEELRLLKKDTLYICTNAMMQKFGYNKDLENRVDQLMRYYDYPYQLIDSSPLSKKIMESSDVGINFMTLNRIGAGFCFSVYNSAKGTQLYARYNTFGYDLKSTHMSALSKLIRGL